MEAILELQILRQIHAMENKQTQGPRGTRRKFWVRVWLRGFEEHDTFMYSCPIFCGRTGMVVIWPMGMSTPPLFPRNTHLEWAMQP